MGEKINFLSRHEAISLKTRHAVRCSWSWCELEAPLNLHFSKAT